jgi:hypothetical protein
MEVPALGFIKSRPEKFRLHAAQFLDWAILEKRRELRIGQYTVIELV